MTTTFDSEKLHPLTKLLLEKRGVKGKKEIEDFLFPSYENHIGNPFNIHGMEEAVVRILGAMRSGEKIAVYSDYDCDGVPGGVLLREFFDTISYPVEMYIPHRHNEGYGIHTHAVDALKEKGVTLIITVDLAITNIEEIAYAKSVGVDFIVSDHHLPITEEVKSGKLKVKSKFIQIVPDAVAVINSKQDVCTYDDDMLCGCAVAWKIACGVLSRLREEAILYMGVDGEISLNADLPDGYRNVLVAVSRLPDGYEKWMLDLVGISTISDMVPLVKENRALAHYGLRVLQKTKRPGLLHIFNEQRMKKEYLTEEDIAFTIAPRVNAASRMGDPIQAHLMLYEKDKESAEGYARDLELLNTQRKAEVKDIVSGIVFSNDVYKNDVVVVGDASWGPGILGLVAQKIIDETGKPVFVWGQGDDKTSMKGSCRSRGDVHVVDLMAHVGHDVFSHWGGHEQAGGFSVLVENIDKLSDALNASIGKIEKKDIASQTAVADTELSMDDINEVTFKAVSPLAPFGVGNPKPIFSFKNVTPLATKRFGKKSEHLEIIYPTSNGGKIKAIQFFVSEETEKKAQGAHTLLANIEKSFFGFKVELRLRIVDIQ
jgi:single-stranded-DNA-specific exonuclease